MIDNTGPPEQENQHEPEDRKDPPEEEDSEDRKDPPEEEDSEDRKDPPREQKWWEAPETVRAVAVAATTVATAIATVSTQFGPWLMNHLPM